MRIEHHPSVRQDVAEAMRRYKSVSQRLADDFKTELRRVNLSGLTESSCQNGPGVEGMRI